MLFLATSCGTKSPVDNGVFDLSSSDNTDSQNITETKVLEEPEYENVSRPIKNFWIVRGSVLALTEANELCYGKADTANPIFITANIKEMIISEDGYYGLILLNDGIIIKVNNVRNTKDTIFINEI